MRMRQYLGSIALMLFIGLFVFMMNKVSAPNATFELGDYVIIVDLIIAFLFLMIAWGPVVNGEPVENALPFRVPSAVAIPLGVALFVFLYVSGLGEILLHVNEVLSPALAISVAVLILGGATYLDWHSPNPTPEQRPTADHEHEHAVITQSSPGPHDLT
jgi:hypothetical protein